MTVPVRNARRVIVNDGNITHIDVSFPAEQATYVRVYAGDVDGALTLLAIGSDYTLTGASPGNTSFTVNLVNPTAWDAASFPRFAVFVDYPVEQPNDLALGGVFGGRFEAALDRLTQTIQSVNDRVNRALKMPVTVSIDAKFDMEPVPNTVIGFGPDNELTYFLAADLTSVTGLMKDFSPIAYGNGLSSAVATVRLRPQGDGKRTSVDYGDWQIGQDPQTTESSAAFLYFYNKVIGQTPMRILNDGQMLRYYYWDSLIPGGNAYDKTGTPDNTFFIYGQHNAATTGTAVASRRELIVYNVGTPTSGKSEFAADYAVTTVRGDGFIAPGSTFWNGDNHFVTPESALVANSPHFEVGRSLRYINLANGMSSPNANQKGAWGYAVGGAPTDTAANIANGNNPTARTYPIVAAYQAYGHSGAPGVLDGNNAAADYFALIGFRVGGIGGGPYYDYNTTSKFKWAFEANDWTDAAFIVGTRHPSGTGQGVGIVNPYQTIIGGAGVTSSVTAPALIVNYNNSGVSRHAAIQFGTDLTGDYWKIARDIAGDGGINLCFYSNTAKVNAAKNHLLALGGQSTGGIGFLGSNPVVKQTVTGSRGGNAALASAIAALAAFGLVTDATTA